MFVLARGGVVFAVLRVLGWLAVGRRSKVVDRDEAIRMLRSGVTYAQMVQFYKGKYGIDTTTMTWSRFSHSFMDERRAPEYRYDFIPWNATKKSKGARLRQGLWAVSRQASGDELSSSAKELARQLKNRLLKNDSVVDYDPDNDVFLEVPRRKGIDQGWIKDPFVNDLGRPISPSEHIRGESYRRYCESGGICLQDFERPLAEGEARRQPSEFKM